MASRQNAAGRGACHLAEIKLFFYDVFQLLDLLI
jgi:hypothetical protein